MLRTLTTCCLLLFLMACKSTQQPKISQNEEDIITLKFVQVNDVYEIAPLSGGKYGGMARVAYVTDSIRKSHPNTYLFMAGDFLNPSLLGTIKVDGERLRGKHMIEVMNAMDFDLVTFGNHEFDLDEEDFQKRLDESEFQWTSANVMQKSENGTKPFAVQRGIGNIKIPTTYTLTVSDADGTQVRLGFFSVTLGSNPREYVHYGDVFTEAENAFSVLKPQADVIIGLTHLAVSEDVQLAKQLTSIPLIMGGHEHNSMLVSEGNTTIAKADANAKTVYIHTLVYNQRTGEVAVGSELFPIDDSTPSDPEVAAIVDKWGKVLDEKIKEVIENPNEVIYIANPPIDGTDSANRGIQTNLGDLVTAAMAASFNDKPDAAIVNAGSFRLDDMLQGNITSLDVFRVLPFGGEVVKIDITGELLIEVLNFGKNQSGNGAYLQRHNIEEGPSGGWILNGDTVEGGKKYYTIAISDFLLKGYDIPFLTDEHPGVLKVYKTQADEPAKDIRKAVILYLKSLN